MSPTLSVANLDSTISALCLAYQNMVQARVTIRMTFAHYLDARNFPEGNPQADPTQEKIDVFYIDSKTHEDNESIHFALSSPADLQGIQIPTRQIHSLCTWCMRGLYRNHLATIRERGILMRRVTRLMTRQKMRAGV